MKKIPLILLSSLLAISCREQSGHNFKVESFSSEFKSNTKDSLINYYEQAIIDYYCEADSSEYKVKLEITGKREYEDDSILILTFDEILKFGSWHYSNSSLFFLKNGNSLIPISPSSTDLKILNDDFYERDLLYPNRIHGKFTQKIDLTGDGKSEYIFHSTGSIKTSFEESYNIYQMNPDNQTLELFDLSISSNGIQGECDTTFGELSEFEIIENDSINPIIEIIKIMSTCNDSTFKVENLSRTVSYYVWDEQKNKFINLPE